MAGRFREEDRERILSGAIPWSPQEFEIARDKDRELRGRAAVSAESVREIRRWIEARFSGDGAVTAASHAYRYSQMMFWMARHIENLEAIGVLALADEPEYYRDRHRLAVVLAREPYTSLDHTVSSPSARVLTYDCDRVAETLQKENVGPADAPDSLQLHAPGVSALEKELRGAADHPRYGRSDLLSEVERAIEEWWARATPLLSPHNRRVSPDGSRHARAWIAEGFTSHRNYVLEWFPCHPDDWSAIRASGTHDFRDFTDERTGWFGDWGDPFNRILMIRGARNLPQNAHMRGPTRAFLDVITKVREEIVQAAIAAGVELHVARTITNLEDSWWFSTVDHEVPDTPREYLDLAHERMEEVMARVRSRFTSYNPELPY